MGHCTEEWKSMRFNDFRIQILLRLLLVVLSLYGLIYYLYIEVNFIRVFFLLMFAIFVLASLFLYLNKSNKNTKNFLLAILNNDFTIKYNSGKQGKSFDELYDTFNLVNDKFTESTQAEASQYQYIVTLINQLQIGVLAYDEKNRIHLTNDSFKNLLQLDQMINLESIRQKNETLHDQIKSIENGDNLVFKTTINNQVHSLSMAASTFKLRNRTYKLISFQDIHSELDQNEMEAWQKLIRVLTHEIMNSVAPITSLSTTLKGLVQKGNVDEEKTKTLAEGLDAIEVRSQGLMNFTQAYRSLTRIPLPNIREVDSDSFFQRISSLFRPTISKTQIDWELELLSKESKLLIDPDLMEQVFINLLKNAKEAVSMEKGIIKLSMRPEEGSGRQIITISDNGKGIPDDISEKIFIPFYTTKTEGSGVGLSLARQIVQMHQGELSFQTSRQGTSFSIKL